jgi:hypothetical protein
MKEAIQRRERGDETLREIARTYDVSHITISRLVLSRITLSDGLVIAAFDGLPSSGSRLP